MEPTARWVLLDARTKKVAAVAGFVEALGLENVEPVTGRAENLARDPHRREGFDGVISRAVGPLPTVTELSRGFLRDGGRIVAVRGPQVEADLAALGPALPHLGVGEVGHQRISGTTRETWLVTMRAVGRAPQAMPRPDGTPAARPLGSGPRG